MHPQCNEISKCLIIHTDTGTQPYTLLNAINSSILYTNIPINTVFIELLIFPIYY